MTAKDLLREWRVAQSSQITGDPAGRKTHLLNGVCSAPACPDGPATGCVDCKYANWDYTLVQPLEL